MKIEIFCRYRISEKGQLICSIVRGENPPSGIDYKENCLTCEVPQVEETNKCKYLNPGIGCIKKDLKDIR